MSDLVSISRRDPQFRSYLMGTFSRTQRALPLKSLNVRTERETVTFKIVPVEKQYQPLWPVKWMKALRPRSYLQVLIPLLYVITRLASEGQTLDRGMTMFVIAGLICLHASLLLRNDVQDHVSGYDLMRTDRGSRAIQTGWLTANDLKTASTLFLILACICAGVLGFARPGLLAVFGAAAFIGGSAFFRGDRSFRDLETGEFSVFLLNGPLLLIGLRWALGGDANWETLSAGALWGWMILFPLHLRDLENLIAEGQSGRGSLVGRLGFDRSVRMIHIWWFMSLAGFAAFQYEFGGKIAVWILLMALIMASAPFAKGLRTLKSPAGSVVALLRKRGETLYRGLILLWVLDSLWRMPW